jgi:hypothetical protein
MLQVLKDVDELPAQIEKAAPECVTAPAAAPSLINAAGRSSISRLVLRARQLASPHRNKIYMDIEKLFSLLSTSRALRILIGESPELQTDMQSGFRRLRHTVEFAPITSQSFSEYDLVVPMSVRDLMQAREWPELVLENAIPFPSPECVSLCDDKFEFNQRLIASGFGVYVPKMGSGLERPYILKKRIGIWGRECRVIHDLKDKADAMAQINDPAYFCQEIVRGRQEFATHILFVNGRIAKSLNIMYEFESETPIKGQDPFLYRVIHRCPYLDLFSSILNSVGFQGLCCVNYKVAGGRPYILEINPRFGGSLAPYFSSFVRGIKPRRSTAAKTNSIAMRVS